MQEYFLTLNMQYVASIYTPEYNVFKEQYF